MNNPLWINISDRVDIFYRVPNSMHYLPDLGTDQVPLFTHNIYHLVTLTLISICYAAYDKVPNGRNGVISIVLQRTYQGIRGHPFMTSIKNHIFDPPPPCPHGPEPLPPCGRPHTVDMKYTPLS